MSSLFLFGAGASFGSGPCKPHAPPLGGALFDALRSEGGVSATVPADLAELFRQDFEAAMDRFWVDHHTRTTELLRDMARYFCKFEPSPGNLYIRLINAIGTRKRAVLATTNYDLLLEHAVANAGLLVCYSGLPAPPRNIPVLKIHGSCNFLPDIAGRIKGIAFDVSGSDVGSMVEAEVRVARSAAEVASFCRREDSIAPALAMYHPSKRVLYGKQFVSRQQDAFLASIREASRIYVIGLRVHLVDTHIWKPLAKAKAPLYYVGREPEDIKAWAESNRRMHVYAIATAFEDALPIIARH